MQHKFQVQSSSNSRPSWFAAGSLSIASPAIQVRARLTYKVKSSLHFSFGSKTRKRRKKKKSFHREFLFITGLLACCLLPLALRSKTHERRRKINTYTNTRDKITKRKKNRGRWFASPVRLPFKGLSARLAPVSPFRLHLPFAIPLLGIPSTQYYEVSRILLNKQFIIDGRSRSH